MASASKGTFIICSQTGHIFIVIFSANQIRLLANPINPIMNESKVHTRNYELPTHSCIASWTETKTKPVYSINKPKSESLAVLRILDNMKDGEGRPKMMKKGRLIDELEKAGIIDKNLSIGAKHSKLKGLLNSITIAGSDNPLVEVEYKAKHSNVILTTQGESTLKIFGE